MMTTRLVTIARRNMAASRRMTAVTARAFSVSAANSALVDNVHPGYAKIKEKQKMFQLDDGKRIHEKTALDRGLYSLTQLLILISAVVWSMDYWKASKLYISFGIGLKDPEA